MTAVITTIPASITLAIGNTPVETVVEFGVPLEASVERTGPNQITLTPPQGLGRAFAAALRKLADEIDPDVVELPADLEPGAVVIRCPQCPATMVGTPGDTLEHADDGAHVFAPTYGS